MLATVVIPAYNEEKRIAKVLKRMPKGYEVIVVDDGSTDETASVVKRYGYKCIRLPKNKGKAEACKMGAKNSRTENIIFMDADFQMDPREVPKFYNALKEADLVIGNRKMKRVPLQRRIANSFAKKMIKIITKKQFNDVLCGYRAIKKDALMKLNLKEGGYKIESEMTIKAVRAGLRIKEIPVSVSYKDYAGMPVTKSLKVVLYLLKNAFGRR